MEIVIDTTRLIEFSNLEPFDMFWAFFFNIGWMIIAIVILYGLSLIYLQTLRSYWTEKNLKFILLAIDIPRGNEQSPKAVENMFSYLGGTQGSVNFFEKWFEGMYQLSFSYEIVSLEGYTQFLIRLPIQFRDLVETSIYSQYPDAEISEVEDYVDTLPHKFPDEEYDIWGSEFILSQPRAYPIKLYQEFEHHFGDSETQFKDPMSSFMDLCGSLREGEQLWYQVILIPTGFDWLAESDQEVDKILGKKKKSNSLTSKLMKWMSDMSEYVYEMWADIEDKEAADTSLSMFDLTPKQVKQIEGIQNKASKLAFEVKIRVAYIARKDLFNRSKVVSGLVGYMKQFSALHLNSFMPDVGKSMTKTSYFFKNLRLIRKKNRLIRNYVNRSDVAGARPAILNIEELATIWHFPLEANVKASMVQKAMSRKVDAPASLPLSPDFLGLDSGSFQSDILDLEQEAKQAEAKEKDYELDELMNQEDKPKPKEPALEKEDLAVSKEEEAFLSDLNSENSLLDKALKEADFLDKAKETKEMSQLEINSRLAREESLSLGKEKLKIKEPEEGLSLRRSDLGMSNQDRERKDELSLDKKVEAPDNLPFIE